MKLSVLLAYVAALATSAHALALEKRASPGVISFPLKVNPSVHHASIKRRNDKRSGDVSTPDTNYNRQLLFLIELMIGTPPQKTSVQLDTGSSDLIVETPSNNLCQAASPNPCTMFGSCKLLPRYCKIFS
jgi:hypothetical protein